MKNTETKEMPVLELERLDANHLPELQGWKEAQLQLVKENPFVEIVDNKTYESAKKARTTLVTGRTTIEKQERTIAAKLKDFRTKISEESKKLIAITLPYEQKQQEEVKRYEAKKEEEKREKERLEQLRKDAIKDNISAIYSKFNKDIQELPYAEIDDFKNYMSKKLEEESEKDMEEFDLEFAEKVKLLKYQLDNRIKYLEEAEAQRLENERLEAEREKMEEEKKAIEAERAENERKANEAKRVENERLEAERKKIEEERAKVEAEKKALQDKLEAERKAKEAEELKLKQETERIEAEKRAEALRPDVEKLRSIINKIQIPASEIPHLKSNEAKEFLKGIQAKIDEMKEVLSNQLLNLK